MKAVDISFGAVGFEPSSAADQVGALDVAHLRTRGVSEKVISMYVEYRDKHYSVPARQRADVAPANARARDSAAHLTGSDTGDQFRQG
jgi:hypothetical protein